MSHPLTAASTLAEVADRHPDAPGLLEAHGLDYCCGGSRTLAEACAEQGVDPEVVLAVIDGAAPGASAPAWRDLGPGALADHIEATHHAYLARELPRLDALAEKVARVHGERHPELAGVVAALRAVRAELEPHLLKEERVLFPMIRELDGAERLPSFHCGSVRNPIAVMFAEHEQAGDLLRALRHAARDFAVPDDGCASYQALMAGLEALEADTHVHIHKENNVLFPAVFGLERRLSEEEASHG